MRSLAKNLGFGLVTGLLLSALVPPLGLDLLQLPALAGDFAYRFRAAPFLALWVAYSLWRGREDFAGGWQLVGATLGFLGHGLFLRGPFEPTTRLGFGLLFVALTVVLVALARVRSARVESAPEATPAPSGTPLLARLGLFLTGAGLALGLENLARGLRLFGGGLPEDGVVVGGVLLGLAWVGAVSFTRLVPSAGAHRELVLASAAGGIACALAAYGLHLLGGLHSDALYAYWKRFGVGFTDVGAWKPLAILAGASLVAPGFALGVVVRAPRRAELAAPLAGGAGLGLLAVPFVVDAFARSAAWPEVFTLATTTLVFATACVLAAVGCALASLAGARGRIRLTGGAVALATLASAFFPARPVWSFSPWYRIPVEPVWARHTGHGMMTVELERGGEKVVTLDRRRLSPTGAEAAASASALAQSLALVPAERRAQGALRLLFVGQLTPLVAFQLRELGDVDVDRTAPWYDVFEELERELFGATPPSGHALSPAEARRRIAAESYDLIYVAPTHGPLLFPTSAYLVPWGIPPAPVFGALDAPEGTVVVAWVDASAPLAARALPERALLAQTGYQHLRIGFVAGDVAADSGDASNLRARLVPTGAPSARRSGLARLRRRGTWRAEHELVDLTRRLADAGDDPVLEGLALHYAAQKHSSPWESLALQTEIVEDELRAYFAGSKESMDPFARTLWESIAAILVEKRRADLILVWVEPVAARYGPWPLLERAVAQAYKEFGEVEEAAAVLERLVQGTPHDIPLRLDAADWSLRAGHPERALEHLRHGLDLQPGHTELEHQLAFLLIRLGDPEGRERLEARLAAHPEEADELEPWLTADPDELPPLPEGFLPGGGHDHEH